MKKIVFLVCITLLTLNLQAQNHERTIRVVGEAIIHVTPEHTKFNIPLKIIDPTYLGCSNALNKTLTDLRADLVKHGISEDDVHTSHYNISENLVYEDGKRVQQGYKGSVSVMVSDTYSKEFVQKVLNSVDKLELSYAIDFSLTSEQKEALSKVAMKNAVKDAREKAEVLAEASEVELGEISQISYGERSFMPGPLTPQRMEISNADFKSSNDLHLNPPVTSLNRTVTIVWRID